MQENRTDFDINRPHIHINVTVINPEGILCNVAGVLDTGAPRTEFSAHYLCQNN